MLLLLRVLRSSRRAWHTFWLSTISCAVTLACLPSSSSAFETCQSKNRLYTDSPSCYNVDSKERPTVGRFDISKATFLKMVKAANLKTSDAKVEILEDTSPLRISLQPLEAVVGTLSETDTIIFYYDNDWDEKGNSDCFLYYRGANSDQLNKIEPSLDKLDPICDNASFDFAELYKEVTSPEKTALVGPFEHLFFAKFKEPMVAEIYSGAAIDKWLLFNRRFNTLKRATDPRFLRVQEISIPTWTYVNEKTQSFQDIVQEIKSDLDWIVIWDINIDKIKNPLVVKEGVEVQIPAQFEDWIAIVYEGLSPEDLALKYYDDKSYIDMVKRLADVRKYQKDKSLLYLPIFGWQKPLSPGIVSSLDFVK